MRVSSTCWVSFNNATTTRVLLSGMTFQEHYFEMSHEDATTSLKVYKQFCRQCEKVVTYLGVAKKMQNILNVQIPNLKHVRVA